MEISITKAKTCWPELIARAEGGEEIILTRRGIPVASLTRWVPRGKQRVLGTARGRVKINDDFDEPVPGFEEFCVTDSDETGFP